MSYSQERALRVDPADFSSMSDKLGQSGLNTETAVVAIETLMASYNETQQGPDVVLIGLAVEALVAGFRSSISGFSYVSEAFSSANTTLMPLQTESDELWRQVSLVDSDISADDDTKFREWFDDIRSQEERVMSSLVGSIDQAPTGDDVVMPPGVAGLINRLIDAAKDAGIDAGLAAAQVLLADYTKDADFDLSDEEIELLLTEGVDPKIKKTILEGLDFPDGDRFSDEEIEKLLSGDIDSGLAIQILEDPGLGFPDEELMDSVHEAMAAGGYPSRVGLDVRYFPPWYIDYLGNEAKIDGAESRRDQVDGVRIVPDWLDPSDRQGPRADIDMELVEIRAKKAEFEERYNIDERGRVDVIDSISTTGERLGGDYWKGKKLAHPAVSNEDKRRAVSEIVEHPESSTGFFNTIGPRLEPFTRLLEMGPQGEDSVKVVSVALGEASRHEGKNELDFDGIEFGELGGANQAISELLIEGDFDEDFWVDATAQFIIDRPQPMGSSSYTSPPTGSGVLSKASNDPALTARIIQELETREPDFAALLGSHPYGGGGEALAEFLAVSGKDPESARKILIAGAEYEDFKDPGTAAGVDAIMARHVTILYDERYLTPHGISPEDTGRLSQEEMERLGFDPQQWNALAENVHEHGFGGFTAAGNEQLMLEAMQSDIRARENGSPSIVDFERFAYVSGVLDEQEFQARLAIANDSDSTNQTKNQRAQIAASVAAALFISGAVATPTPIDDAVILSLDIGAGTGVSLFFPEFWETGEVFEITEEDRQSSDSVISEKRTKGRLVWLQVAGQEVEVPVKNELDIKVTVSVVNETVEDPETGVTTTRPVMRAVDQNGDPWRPEAGESLDWNHLDKDMPGDAPHPANQSGSDAVGIVGSEQGFNEVQAEKSGTQRPGANADSSFEGVSPDDRKAVNPWLGL